MRSIAIAVMLLVAGVWAAEDGSKANPLTVSSAQDLVDLGEAVKMGTDYKGVTIANMGAGLHFKQTADIDLSTVCGREIGNWHSIGPFAGSYDGANHKISNLFIDEDVDMEASPGLFGIILSNTTDTVYYENIVLDKAYIHASGIVGGILSQAVSGVVAVRNNKVDLEFKSGASGTLQFGGVVGNTLSESMSVRGNSVKGSILVTSGDMSYVAGILGLIVGGTVEMLDNVNEANFVVKGDVLPSIGGNVGLIAALCTMKNNTNKGDILVESTKKTNTKSELMFIGGLVAVGSMKGYAVSIVGNVNYGKVEVSGGNASVGGIFGLVQADSTALLDSCFNMGEVIYHGAENPEAVYVGGAVGMWEGVEATRLENSGNILVENAAKPSVGGLVGFVRNGTKSIKLTKSVNKGKITVKNEQPIAGWVAGLVGSTDSLNFAELNNCTNKGNIEIVGKADASLVTSELAVVYMGTRFLANASVNEGEILFLADGPIELPAPVVKKSLNVRVVDMGAGRITLEIPGMDSFASGRVRAGVYSYDGRRQPVSLNASGNLLHLEGLPSAGRFLVRVSTPSGNSSVPVTLR